MKILIACEESQAVTIAMRNNGHEAYSCDLLPCSGGHPEWHIQGDASAEVIKSNCNIIDYTPHVKENGRYDLVVSFPPCTDLSVSGAKHFAYKRDNGSQRASIEFFFKMWFYSHVIENPVGIMSGGTYVKKWFPDLYERMILNKFSFDSPQIVHPWQFGHKASKKTCLWVKGGVPELQPTNIVGPPKKYADMSSEELNQWTAIHRCPPSQNRAIIRSKTYSGIAQAMADQWAPKIV